MNDDKISQWNWCLQDHLHKNGNQLVSVVKCSYIYVKWQSLFKLNNTTGCCKLNFLRSFMQYGGKRKTVARARPRLARSEGNLEMGLAFSRVFLYSAVLFCHHPWSLRALKARENVFQEDGSPVFDERASSGIWRDSRSISDLGSVRFESKPYQNRARHLHHNFWRRNSVRNISIQLLIANCIGKYSHLACAEQVSKPKVLPRSLDRQRTLRDTFGLNRGSFSWGQGNDIDLSSNFRSLGISSCFGLCIGRGTTMAQPESFAPNRAVQPRPRCREQKH